MLPMTVGCSAASERSFADAASGNATATVVSAPSAPDKNRLETFLLFTVEPPYPLKVKLKNKFTGFVLQEFARSY
jgi:hypothetical protein